MRKEKIQICRDGRVNLDLAKLWTSIRIEERISQRVGVLKQSFARIFIRYCRQAGDAQPFDQRFICGEEKGLVLANRAADCAAELIALESGNFLIRRIEEVFRVEGRIAMKLEERSGESVLARACDGIDHATCRSSEFG